MMILDCFRRLVSGPGHEPTYDTPPLVTARHESLQTSGAPGHYYADQVYSDGDSDDDNDDGDHWILL